MPQGTKEKEDITEKLQAQIAAMQAQLEDLQAPKKKKKGDTRLKWRDIEEFISDKNPRPDTEFYILTDVRSSQFIQIIPDSPSGREEDPNSRGRRNPAFNLEMVQANHGIGSDLKNSKGERKYWVYMTDLAKHPLVEIKKEDLDGDLRLAGDVRVKSGEYSLSRVMDALKDSPSYKMGRLITGEQFRVRMAGEYETIKASREIEDKARRKFESLSPAQQKAGMAAV